MRVLIAHNPRAGQGDSGIYDYVRELSSRGVEVVMRPLTEERTLERAVQDAEDFDRVVAAGGDGTVGAAAYLLRNTGIPLLPYPSGTGNLISRNLQEPIDPAGLATTTLEGSLVRTDLGEVTYDASPQRIPKERRRVPRPRQRRRVGFTGIAGVGADASLMAAAHKLKPMFGEAGYLMAVLRNPTPRVSELVLDLDGRRIETEGSAVLFVNFARLQFDLSIVHDSDARDGYFEVVVVKARRVTELVPAVMAAMLDTVVTYPDRSQVLDTYRARKVTVRATPPLPLQTDGENHEAATPLNARVLPLASTFVVPIASADTAT